jgi:NAD+ synthase (glutamine-hydrolysing)
VYGALLTGLRHLDHLRGGENKYLVALSGGIDSSVVACLLVKAFGAERVYGVNLPTRFNAAVTQDNARQLSQVLGIDYLSLPIEDLYTQVAAQIKAAEFARGPGNYTRLVDENIQARIRFADILSGLAAKYGLLFTNNGNKTEVALGYCTLYGDVAGAVAPIGDLYKVQVFALGRYLNEVVFGAEVIPENILSGATVPSAELSEAQDVTKGLGDPIKYGYHDALLRQLIEYRRHPADVLQWLLDGELFARLGWRDEARFRAYFPTVAAWVEDLEWVERQLRISYFKRIQAPPIIVLSKRAFGFDLRETQTPGYTPRRYGELKKQVLNRENW